MPAPSEAAPVVSDAPLPKPATETAAEATGEISRAQWQPDAPPSPINEVIPDVSRSARETIRGTIRVSIRVIVDKQGAVLDATADEPGPSRYFERLVCRGSKEVDVHASGFGRAARHAGEVLLQAHRDYSSREATAITRAVVMKILPGIVGLLGSCARRRQPMVQSVNGRRTARRISRGCGKRGRHPCLRKSLWEHCSRSARIQQPSQMPRSLPKTLPAPRTTR